MVFGINRTSSTFDSDVLLLLRIGISSFLILKYVKTEPVVLYLVQITTQYWFQASTFNGF
jgi:hypothetical protein